MTTGSFRGKLAELGDKAGFGEAAYARRWAKRGGYRSAPAVPADPPATPLTANQHILHLLLTIVTAGLWLPVWIIRAMQGNRR